MWSLTERFAGPLEEFASALYASPVIRGTRASPL
jgi:hypothetical protein